MKKPIAIVETKPREDYKFWAVLHQEDGTVSEVSSHSKLSLIHFLSDSNCEIELEGTSSSELITAEQTLTVLLSSIPHALTIDDERVPDAYDDFSTAIPYIEGANAVISQIRQALEKLGFKHKDSKYHKLKGN